MPFAEDLPDHFKFEDHVEFSAFKLKMLHKLFKENDVRTIGIARIQCLSMDHACKSSFSLVSLHIKVVWENFLSK